ncbi:MAG: hydrogenase maturation protease [Verrucomicrobiales bacterium]
MKTTAIIGIGNEFRRDDGVGRFAARQLAKRAGDGIVVHESNGEALSLMELWSEAATVILIDAAEATSDAGTVHRLDASEDALPSDFLHASTHTFSVAEAIEMARSLDRLPETVIVYGIQVADTGHGTGLTAEAEHGAQEAVERILQELP